MINDETATEKEFTKAFELIDFIDYDNKTVDENIIWNYYFLNKITNYKLGLYGS